MVRPGITTVTQHTVSFGKRCAEVLLSRLNGDAEPGPTIVHVQPELLVRGSTSAPRAG